MKNTKQTMRRLRAHRGRDGGFTLLEILVALIVMSIGLLGVLALFPVSINRVSETAKRSQAAAIATSFHQALVVGIHNSSKNFDKSLPVDHVEGAAIIHHAGLINRGGDLVATDSYNIPQDSYALPLPPPPPSGGSTDLISYAFPWPIDSGPFQQTDNPAAPWGGRGTGNASDVGLLYPGEKSSKDYIWQLGQVNDGNPKNDLYDLILDVKGEDGTPPTYDPSFDLDKYSFSVLIQRTKRSVDYNNNGKKTRDDRLYRVLISVYRYYRGRPSFSPPYTSSDLHPDLIREYRTMISG